MGPRLISRGDDEEEEKPRKAKPFNGAAAY